MIFQENEKCPVCDKLFTKDDVIVICPGCGTPHHRECYDKQGHCCNADKHSQDFEYSVKENNKSFEDNYYHPENENSDSVSDAGQYNSQPQRTGAFIQLGVDNEYDKSSEIIEDKKVSEVAAVVKTNTRRFIPKFLKNSNISWNWGGFIFGPYYLLFRKMISPGIIFIALNLIVQYIAMGFYMEPLTKYMEFMNSAQNYNEAANLISSNMDKVSKMMNELMPMFWIIIGTVLLIHTVIALFADKMYRSRVLKIVDNVNEKIKNGGVFNQNSMFESGGNLTQEQMKKLYLGKMGGTSLFIPFMAWIAQDLLSQIISRF